MEKPTGPLREKAASNMGHPVFVVERKLLLVAFAAGGIAAAVAFFVALEGLRLCGGFRFVADVGHSALVAVLGIEAVVHRAMEFVCAVEPGAYANEYTAVEILRSDSSRSGCSAVGGVVIVAVGAGRFGANADADLGLCGGCCSCQGNSRNR